MGAGGQRGRPLPPPGLGPCEPDWPARVAWPRSGPTLWAIVLWRHNCCSSGGQSSRAAGLSARRRRVDNISRPPAHLCERGRPAGGAPVALDYRRPAGRAGERASGRASERARGGKCCLCIYN